MPTITSQFQGAINVPLFLAPYTVTLPATYPFGVASGSAMNPNSDTPCIFSGAWQDINSVNNQPIVILNGGFVALNYQRASTFTLNNGWSASGNHQVKLCYTENEAAFGFSWAEHNDANHFSSWFGVSVNPFAINDRTVSNTIAPPASINNVNAYAWTSNNTLAYQNMNGGLFTGVFTNALTNFASQCYAGVVSDQFDHAYLVALIPGVSMNSASMAASLSGFLGSANYAGVANFGMYGAQPDNYVVGAGSDTTTSVLNYLFGFSALNSQISYAIWNAPFAGGVPSLNVLETGTLVFDNNSNLNAQLSKYNSNSVMTGIGKRGMLATDLDSGIDYFVSRDGSKYWQLAYQPQSGAVKMPLFDTSESTHKFVDKLGTFWYTGAPTRSGNTIQPYYSFGFNIPYGIFSLNFPPVYLPCYDPCLGTDWPLTKIQRMK